MESAPPPHPRVLAQRIVLELDLAALLRTFSCQSVLEENVEMARVVLAPVAMDLARYCVSLLQLDRFCHATHASAPGPSEGSASLCPRCCVYRRSILAVLTRIIATFHIGACEISLSLSLSDTRHNRQTTRRHRPVRYKAVCFQCVCFSIGACEQ